MLTDAGLIQAIASPRRREILRLTWSAERGAGDLRRAMPDVSWGAVSQQVSALVDAGLLRARIDGRHRYYRADRDRLSSVAAMLESMWNDALWKLKLAAELEASRRGPASARARHPPARGSARQARAEKPRHRQKKRSFPS